jgi:glycopeptide antibiotics resistance protein
MPQLIFIAYVLLVITLSLIPTAMGGSGLYSDKLAHFLAYGGMGFLAYMSVDSVKKRFYLFLLVISLGVVLEFFQLYIPGRSTSFFDIVANTLGAGLGYFLGWIFLVIAVKNVLLNKESASNEAATNFRDNLKNAL